MILLLLILYLTCIACNIDLKSYYYSNQVLMLCISLLYLTASRALYRGSPLHLYAHFMKCRLLVSFQNLRVTTLNDSSFAKHNDSVVIKQRVHSVSDGQ